MTATPASESSGASGPSARRSALFWTAAAAVLVLDLWSKHAVFALLHADPAQMTTHSYGGIRVHPVLGHWVSFVALLNPGMMWGAFQDHPTVLKIVRPVAVVVIFVLLSSLPAGQWCSRLALGGILGGALGNIYDSFRYVGVRDFLQVDLDVPVFDPFPAFNVADSAICVGVVVLALGMMRGSKHREVEKATAAAS